jgi:hypothetical protein
MKSLEEFLAEKREITIHTLTSYIKQYMREQSQSLLQEQQEEMVHIFDKAGEYAYGVFFRKLCQPIQQQLTQAGFVCEPGYPGDFRSASIEYWGPPEERERCLWSVVKTAQGITLGTIVTQVFHDHSRFRLPLPPGVLALEETDNDAIIEALSHASVRLRGTEHEESTYQAAVRQEQPGWEYSVEIGLGDYIDPNHLEISETMLDHALSLWGRHGWELVTAIPHEGRMIAFFKRPVRGNT